MSDLNLYLAPENDDSNINVPRDANIGNKDVTKEVEKYILDYISRNPEEPFTDRELLPGVRQKLASKYGWDLLPHIAWALDMYHSNHFVKKVAPGVWESEDGPDEAYAERRTGYAPEGEFHRRGKNFRAPRFADRKEYNHQLKKADFAVRTLKNKGESSQDIEDQMLATGNFNPVVTKLALKSYFGSN